MGVADPKGRRRGMNEKEKKTCHSSGTGTRRYGGKKESREGHEQLKASNASPGIPHREQCAEDHQERKGNDVRINDGAERALQWKNSG